MEIISHRKEYLVTHFDGRAEPCKKIRQTWFDNKTEDICYFVFGECKDLEMIAQTLTQQYKAILVTGPKVAASSKDRLVQLKNEYMDNFKVFSLPNRPGDHTMMINNNLFFEDKHDMDGHSAHVCIVENATQAEKNFFKDRFLADVNSAKEMKLDAIKVMDVYPGI
ncbi:MAG: hypothetical protein WC379_18345 [Methanoregula sp.]|jgi:hypothetical protein